MEFGVFIYMSTRDQLPEYPSLVFSVLGDSFENDAIECGSGCYKSEKDSFFEYETVDIRLRYHGRRPVPADNGGILPEYVSRLKRGNLFSFNVYFSRSAHDDIPVIIGSRIFPYDFRTSCKMFHTRLISSKRYDIVSISRCKYIQIGNKIPDI